MSNLEGQQQPDDDATTVTSTRIRYVTDDDETEQQPQQRRRQGHLMALLPLSKYEIAMEKRVLQEFRVYVELSAFLAFQHLQHRQGLVLPDLPSRLEGCDFTWTYRHHDTQFSPLQAARELLSYETTKKLMSSNNENQNSHHVNAVESDSTINTGSDETEEEIMAADNNNYWEISSTNSSTTTTPILSSYWTIPVLEESHSTILPNPLSDTTAPPSSSSNSDYWAIPANQQSNSNGSALNNNYWQLVTPHDENNNGNTMSPATSNYWTIPTPMTNAPTPINNYYWESLSPLPTTTTTYDPTTTQILSGTEEVPTTTLDINVEDSDSPRTVPPRSTNNYNSPQRTAVPQRTAPPWPLPPRGQSSPTTPSTTAETESGGRKKRQLQTQQKQQPQQKPFAVLGAARSAVSHAISILGAAYELPQISSSSTAGLLDEMPFFARSVPTNQGDAHALIAYLSQLQEEDFTHVGVLFIDDSWGRRYVQDLEFYANVYGVSLQTFPYQNKDSDNDDDVTKAVMQLKNSNLRYIIALVNPSVWKPIVRTAYDYGIIGNPNYVWMFGDLIELVGDSFALDRETESDIAMALHGTGVVFLRLTPHEAFDRVLASVANDTELQQAFIASHSEPELLQDFVFSSSPGRSLYSYLTYDAMIALGITACETPGLFTGQEFYDNLLKIDFQGVSGRVLLNNVTGTRLGDSLQYQVVNLVMNNLNRNTSITFSADTSAVIELSPSENSNITVNTTVLSKGPIIHTIKQFIYNDNTTTPPTALPELEEDLNLIPDGIRAFGLSMSVFVMLLSMCIAAWVIRNRHRYVIRVSQPFFLVQLCVGSFIVASTIIPMSFQEDMPGLDQACRAVPWLLCLGFTLAISALFSKTYRINQLMNSGTSFRRVLIKPKDVMKPCMIMLAVNIILLIAWTASPFHMTWKRYPVDSNVDEFGRGVESYGVCRPDNGHWHFLFSAPLFITNAAVLAMATWQSYRARDLPVELSETLYLSMSLISLSETLILGIIIVFVVMDQPAAFYLVSSIVIFIGCLSFILPIFAPKIAQRNTREPRGRMSTIVMANRSKPLSGISLGAASNPSTGSVSGMAIKRHLSGSDLNPASTNSFGISGLYHGSSRPSHVGNTESQDLTPFGSVNGTQAVSNIERSNAAGPFGSRPRKQRLAENHLARGKTMEVVISQPEMSSSSESSSKDGKE